MAVGLTFLSPSTAPSPVKRSSPQPARRGGTVTLNLGPVADSAPTVAPPTGVSSVVSIPVGTNVRNLPSLRQITAKGGRAIRTKNKTPIIIKRIERRYNKQEEDGGLLGAISAPFRLAGGFGLNLAREATATIDGTGRLVYENAKDLGQIALSPLPGIDFAPAANRFGERTAGTIKGMQGDLSYTFEPLARGELGTFARRFYKEPLRVGGTVAMVYSGAGAATGAGLRTAARATGNARLAAAGSKKYVAVPGEAVPRRFREPEVITVSRDAYGRDVLPAQQSAVRNLRPRSSNPITREIQRAITDPALNAAKRGVGRIELNVNGRRLNPMSNSARFDRIVRKQSRVRGQQFLEKSDDFLVRTTQTLSGLIRNAAKEAKKAGATGSKKERASQAYYTAAVRAMGLNNLSSKISSRTWGRDSLIKQYEESLAKHTDPENPNANPDYAKMIESNVEGLRSIPDEWLDPARAPEYINNLTKEMEKVLAESTRLKESSGVIQKSTAERSGFRAQEAAAGVFDQASAMREAIVTARKAGQRAVVLRGRIAGLDKDIAALKTEMAAAGPDAAKRQGGQLKSLQQKRRDAVRESNAAVKKERENTKVAEDNRAIVDDALGADMKPGEYFPNFRQAQPGIRARITGRPVLGASPRTTLPPREKINSGRVIREGTAAFSPDISLAALRDAVDVSGRAEALTELLGKYTVRDADGVPITDEAAIRLAKNSNNMYVAKTKRELLRVLRADAKFRDENPDLLGRHGVDTADEAALLSQLEDMAGADTHYLIPRSVEKGWKDALGTRQNLIDDLNKYWKAGVLALSPRWYIQNGFGMSLQFLLGAGLDLRAIKMAASKKYLDSVIAEVDASGLSNELGQYAKQMQGYSGKNPLKRVVIAGYRINNKLESYPRRAMYFHSMRKHLKENDLIGDASMIEAWNNVAKSAAKGEKWANDLIDGIVLDTDRFMGNYARYNPLERVVLRRMFPFYGWMRAINRLAFALPFKYPKRAALLGSASRMAYEMYGDEESSMMDPVAGIITGANNDFFVGTGISMPTQSVKPTFDFIGNAGETLKRNGISGLGQLPAEFIQSTYPQISPIFTDVPEVALGRSALDVPLKFGPGSDNTFLDQRTGRRYGLDAISGQVVDKTPRIGVEGMIGQNFPMYNLARRALAGFQTPNADANLLDLIKYQVGGRKPSDAAKIIQPPNPTGQTLGRTWWGDTLGGLTGVPVYRYSSKNALADQVRLQDKFLRAYLSDIVTQKTNETKIRRAG